MCMAIQGEGERHMAEWGGERMAVWVEGCIWELALVMSGGGGEVDEGPDGAAISFEQAEPRECVPKRAAK